MTTFQAFCCTVKQRDIVKHSTHSQKIMQTVSVFVPEILLRTLQHGRLKVASLVAEQKVLWLRQFL